MKVDSEDWKIIDHWWDIHATEKQKELVSLYELMQELSEEWKKSNTPFDKDPLYVDWSDDSSKTGPMRKGLEENWSYWLTHLLRTAPKYFFKQLFDKNMITTPEKVSCEVSFYGEEKIRRADILIFFKNKGISIEVKIDDTNYAKTPHTAYLIEKDDERDWFHYILLPRSKTPVMKRILGENLQQKPRAKILSKHYPDIDVIYWRDVSLALRRTLLYDKMPDQHWMASAYMFIALIEQKITDMYNIPFLRTNVVDDRTPTISDLLRISSIDTDEQIDYFNKVMEES
ncbi:MAG: hypothetical protein ACOC85_05380 [Thermoplasmatota archaeon]